MPTFGNSNIVQDQSGNALANVPLQVYGNQTDATNKTNLLATVKTNGKGQWPVTVNGLDEVWVRDPAGNIWASPSDTMAADHAARLATLEAHGPYQAQGLQVAPAVTAAGALVTGKHNPVDATSGALTMTLPTSPASGGQVSVEKVDATANAVTVSGSIRGVTTTIALVLQHETLDFVADASGSWWPVAGHKTKSSLDALYPTKWAPSTAYAAGQQVMNPAGDIVTAKAAFTSASTYDDTKWTPPNYFSKSSRARGIVCFTWDDGYPVWDSMLAKAISLGQKHTWAVTTNRIDWVGTGVSTATIQNAFAAGHEIASHTCTHSNVSTDVVATRLTEYDNSKTQLEAIVGTGNVTTFVYPFGGRSAMTDQELYTRYSRVCDFRNAAMLPLNDLTGVFVIPRVSVSFAMAERLIQLAHDQPVVVILASHNPGGQVMDATTGANDGGVDRLTVQQAYDMMQFAHDLGVPCMTLDTVFGGGSLIMDPSFELGFAATQDTWRFSGEGNVVTVTPDTALSGTLAARFSPTGTTGRGCRQLMPVQSGRTYTFSGRARLFSGTLTTGRICGRIVLPIDPLVGPDQATGIDSNGAEVAASANITSTSWTRFTVNYTVPPGVRYIEVQCFLTGQAGIVVDFDHVHFGPSEMGSLG